VKGVDRIRVKAKRKPLGMWLGRSDMDSYMEAKLSLTRRSEASKSMADVRGRRLRNTVVCTSIRLSILR
jgi:hypothetical protein